MLAILDEAGRKFNADEADGVSRRHRAGMTGDGQESRGNGAEKRA